MKPAKKPEEMRGLITELERRIKEAEDLVGVGEVGSTWSKAILISLMDPITRQFTANIQKSAEFTDLRDKVVEFVNHAAPVSATPSADAMDIGRCQERAEEEDWSAARGESEDKECKTFIVYDNFCLRR